MAYGIRRHAALACKSREPARRQLQLVYGKFHTTRRYCCSRRSTRCGDGHGRGIPAPSRCHGPRLQRNSRLAVHVAGGRILCFSKYLANGHTREGTSELAAQRSRSRVLVGFSLRPVRRRAFALQLREFFTKYPGSDRTNKKGFCSLGEIDPFSPLARGWCIIPG